jgi:hypothetical protein
MSSSSVCCRDSVATETNTERFLFNNLTASNHGMRHVAGCSTSTLRHRGILFCLFVFVYFLFGTAFITAIGQKVQDAYLSAF